MKAKLFALLQYITPQHALSRAAGSLARCRRPWVKNTFIEWFIKRYGVDMSEALEENPRAYACFNDFFTRPLKAHARPICSEPGAVVCPADGFISQLGDIQEGRIFQAKGQSYSALELLGGDETLAAEFTDGHFATVYLSPRHYHRVHMPLTGRLRRMHAIPGDLFSVNTATASQVPRLFARNERAVAVFDTDAGPMALVLVGAMIVAGIDTVWAEDVTPAKGSIATTDYSGSEAIELATGQEMGRFKLGSTVIVLFPKGRVEWDAAYLAESVTVMGEKLGRVV
ncbi:archaetidylserine decarboxylase [Marinimicrobium sp. ABcell2]|uniref:archaetidylserine decarboxylase n=1 Tax=Marinimicrobium sp. ABcell2 TaxID=3069751 RepID=UPI0027AF2D6D|nr:archaetidylserine decarboxylase [Marinimicrobium sp. ABcell2]MDQ2076503.1 archaetidylserine decarboxylase [Marinimicrobium sp. ABcell2]